MIDPDREMEELLRLAREAAPSSTSPPHLTEEQLSRLRGGEESEDLLAPYRHAASCEACRARLIDRTAPLRELTVVAVRVDPADEPEIGRAHV